MKTKKKPRREPVVTYIEPVLFLRRYRTRLEVVERVLSERVWHGADVSTEINAVLIKKGSAEMRIKFPSATEAKRAALSVGAVVTASRGAGAVAPARDVPVSMKSYIVAAATPEDALEREFSARHEEDGAPDDSGFGPEVRGEGEYPEVDE